MVFRPRKGDAINHIGRLSADYEQVDLANVAEADDAVFVKVGVDLALSGDRALSRECINADSASECPPAVDVWS